VSGSPDCDILSDHPELRKLGVGRSVQEVFCGIFTFAEEDVLPVDEFYMKYAAPSRIQGWESRIPSQSRCKVAGERDLMKSESAA
jgi:hypothetical protein